MCASLNVFAASHCPTILSRCCFCLFSKFPFEMSSLNNLGSDIPPHTHSAHVTCRHPAFPASHGSVFHSESVIISDRCFCHSPISNFYPHPAILNAPPCSAFSNYLYQWFFSQIADKINKFRIYYFGNILSHNVPPTTVSDWKHSHYQQNDTMI